MSVPDKHTDESSDSNKYTEASNESSDKHIYSYSYFYGYFDPDTHIDVYIAYAIDTNTSAPIVDTPTPTDTEIVMPPANGYLIVPEQTSLTLEAQYKLPDKAVLALGNHEYIFYERPVAHATH